MSNMEKYREQIDRIDDELADLFKQRMDVVADVARHKKEHGLPVQVRDREREIIERMTERNGDSLAISTKVFFNTLFDLSRSSQAKLLSEEAPLEQKIRDAIERTPDLFPQKAVVACQGVEGSYSQQVCDKMFALPSIMYFRNFESVFNAVDKGLCKYGILPIENSSYGSVNEVYDLMKKYRFHIVRSSKLKINHSLLANTGTKLEDIREIYTHDQALGQCSAFVNAHENIRFTTCENTAAAAKLVAESGRKDAAAISSGVCASLYGLTALEHDIQDSDDNYTRFICISKSLEIYPGSHKISLMMAISHTPGSLYQTVAKFASLGLNLCKIESRPIVGTDFAFMFYFDIDASINAPEVLTFIGELQGSCDPFVFLGAYSEY
ncbi:MAG TPA: bifunctional chorismate mutase/prephenate dehydratase [Clostridiales bacterium]|jgi:chorismate mutase/prephenate dehydratase|nr:bifunctional chorismate mutase/prephenate dehydratase [Clostridiales bacterium]